MTVYELIGELQKHDPNVEVVGTWDSGYGRAWSYDGMTGDPRIVYTYSCPRRSRLSELLGWSHPVTESEGYALDI